MTIEHHIKTRVGRVVSDKMDKTAIVEIGSSYSHPIYKKILRRTTRYKAHNENNKAKAGYIVRIIETRPLSKDKRWRIAEIISTGEIIELPAQVIEAPPVEKIAPTGEQPTEVEAISVETPQAETLPQATEETHSDQEIGYHKKES